MAQTYDVVEVELVEVIEVDDVLLVVGLTVEVVETEVVEETLLEL
jgi:hypothetical protein